MRVTKDDIMAILRKINNGWDYAISDYATSEEQEDEYERNKELEMNSVADELIELIKGDK